MMTNENEFEQMGISDIYISIICDQIESDIKFRFEEVRILNFIIYGKLHIEGQIISFEIDAYSCCLEGNTFYVEEYKFRLVNKSTIPFICKKSLQNSFFE